MTTIIPQAKTGTEASKEASREASQETAEEMLPDEMFGTRDEEEADASAWEEQFAATPDDKLNKLIGVVQSRIRSGKASPLDFTNK